MSSLNHVQIIGRLGKEPEIRTTQRGTRIANLSLATSDKWTDKATGDKKEKTEWHRVVCFVDGITGVIEKYVSKGDLVMVEGRLETRKWTDDKGVDRYVTEIVLKPYESSFLMLSSSRSRDEHGDGSQPPQERESRRETTNRAQAPAHDYAADLDDDIPF